MNVEDRLANSNIRINLGINNEKQAIRINQNIPTIKKRIVASKKLASEADSGFNESINTHNQEVKSDEHTLKSGTAQSKLVPQQVSLFE